MYQAKKNTEQKHLEEHLLYYIAIDFQLTFFIHSGKFFQPWYVPTPTDCNAQLRLPRKTRPYIMQGQMLRQTTPTVDGSGMPLPSQGGHGDHAQPGQSTNDNSTSHMEYLRKRYRDQELLATTLMLYNHGGKRPLVTGRRYTSWKLWCPTHTHLQSRETYNRVLFPYFMDDIS